MELSPEEAERWIDRHAVDSEGNKVGTIADVYIDDATGAAEWLAVTTGLFGSRLSFVPLAGSVEVDDDIQVAYEKALVKDSPNIEADGALTEDEEERLYRHYGLSYAPSTPAADTIIGAEQAGSQAELQLAGSASVGEEVSPEVARLRLRKRDADAVRALNLEAEELRETPTESSNPS